MGVTQELCDKLSYQKQIANNPYAKVEDTEDADSIVSDRCWEEMYRGDSRKWLTREPQIILRNMKPTASTMKSSYSYPSHEQLQLKGRRQLLLEAKLLEEVIQEMKEESKEKEVKLDYLTTYEDLHRTPGFRPNDKKDYHEKNIQLYQKYPLYTSPPMSFWQFQSDRSSSNLRSIPGMTLTKDLRNPFKRNSLFTTPVTQALYCDEL